MLNAFFKRFFNPSPLDAALVAKLSALCCLKTLAEGDVLFDKGEAVQHFYWIQHGTVELRLGCKILKTLNAGVLLGEDMVFDAEHATYDYAAVATAPLTLIAVDAEAFMTLVEHNPVMGLKLLKAVAHQQLATLQQSTVADEHTDAEDTLDDDLVLSPLAFIPTIEGYPKRPDPLSFFMLGDAGEIPLA
jgi:CRP-like cAMP-binding protein